MIVDVAANLRTKATARLLRKVSIAAMHDKLMAMFVDRIKLEDEIQENIKPQFDVSVFTTREYMKKEYCYTTFTEPQCKDYYETQFGFDESDLMFINDAGDES
jgi:hypothetical protein